MVCYQWLKPPLLGLKLCFGISKGGVGWDAEEIILLTIVEKTASRRVRITTSGVHYFSYNSMARRQLFLTSYIYQYTAIQKSGVKFFYAHQGCIYFI